jgi:hypothetical protein
MTDDEEVSDIKWDWRYYPSLGLVGPAAHFRGPFDEEREHHGRT